MAPDGPYAKPGATRRRFVILCVRATDMVSMVPQYLMREIVGNSPILVVATMPDKLPFWNRVPAAEAMKRVAGAVRGTIMVSWRRGFFNAAAVCAKTGDGMEDVIKILRNDALGRDIIITGGPNTGKTTFAAKLAEALADKPEIAASAGKVALADPLPGATLACLPYTVNHKTGEQVVDTPPIMAPAFTQRMFDLGASTAAALMTNSLRQHRTAQARQGKSFVVYMKSPRRVVMRVDLQEADGDVFMALMGPRGQLEYEVVDSENAPLAVEPAYAEDAGLEVEESALDEVATEVVDVDVVAITDEDEAAAEDGEEEDMDEVLMTEVEEADGEADDEEDSAIETLASESLVMAELEEEEGPEDDTGAAKGESAKPEMSKPRVGDVPSMETVADLHRYLDADSDGYLNAQELEAMGVLLGRPVCDEEYAGVCKLTEASEDQGLDAKALETLYAQEGMKGMLEKDLQTVRAQLATAAESDTPESDQAHEGWELTWKVKRSAPMSVQTGVYQMDVQVPGFGWVTMRSLRSITVRVAVARDLGSEFRFRPLLPIPLQAGVGEKANKLLDDFEEADKPMFGAEGSYKLWPPEFLGLDPGAHADPLKEETVRSILLANRLEAHYFDQNDSAKAIVAEAEAVEAEASKAMDGEIAARTAAGGDFRSKRVFTIDPESARDLDDAIHVDRIDDDIVEVGVHIADVSHYVKPDSKMDVEARSRCTSVYLPDRVMPMLPTALSNGICSLHAGTPKLTFSAIYRLNKKTGELVTDPEPTFHKGVISSCVRLSYEQAQDVIDKKEMETPEMLPGFRWEDVVDDINLLYEVCGKVRTTRQAAGGLVLSRESLSLDMEDGFATGYHFEEYSASHWVIEELMLKANQVTAMKLAGSKLTEVAVLRQHPVPEEQDVRELAAHIKGLGIVWKSADALAVRETLANVEKRCGRDVLNAISALMVIRTVSRANYIVQSEGDPYHYALNFDLYTHFTSPIRRYADVMVHRQLAAVISGEEAQVQAHAEALAEFKEQCKSCNMKKKASDDAQRVANQAFLCLYMISNKQWIYDEAVVLSVKRSSMEVLIPVFDEFRLIPFWTENDLEFWPGAEDDSVTLPELWEAANVARDGSRERDGVLVWWQGRRKQEIRPFTKVKVVVVPIKRTPVDYAVFLVQPPDLPVVQSKAEQGKAKATEAEAVGKMDPMSALNHVLNTRRAPEKCLSFSYWQEENQWVAKAALTFPSEAAYVSEPAGTKKAARAAAAGLVLKSLLGGNAAPAAAGARSQPPAPALTSASPSTPQALAPAAADRQSPLRAASDEVHAFFDDDGDGHISFEEFVRATARLRSGLHVTWELYSNLCSSKNCDPVRGLTSAAWHSLYLEEDAKLLDDDVQMVRRLRPKSVPPPPPPPGSALKTTRTIAKNGVSNGVSNGVTQDESPRTPKAKAKAAPRPAVKAKGKAAPKATPSPKANGTELSPSPEVNGHADVKAEVAEIHRFFDEDSDGYLSFKEMAAMAKTLRGEAFPETEYNELCLNTECQRDRGLTVEALVCLYQKEPGNPLAADLSKLRASQTAPQKKPDVVASAVSSEEPTPKTRAKDPARMETVADLHRHLDTDSDGYLKMQEIENMSILLRGAPLLENEYEQLCQRTDSREDEGLNVQALEKLYGEDQKDLLQRDLDTVRSFLEKANETDETDSSSTGGSASEASTSSESDKDAKPLKTVADLHRYFDADSDGYLNDKEVTAMATALGRKLDENEYTDMCSLTESTEKNGLNVSALEWLYAKESNPDSLENDLEKLRRSHLEKAAL